MKVALLSDCYLPRLGGIEVQVHDLALRLHERGHEVAVFTATPGPHGARQGRVERVSGVEVHRLAIPLPFELPVNPFAARELADLLRGRYDVAHVHMGVVSPFAVDCTRVVTRLGLPLTMTWHCMLDAFEPVFARLGHVRRWARTGIAMNAVSSVAAAPLQRLVGDAGTVEVLPNGIDLSRWRPRSDAVQEGLAPERAAPEGAAPEGAVRVVSAMRLAARKRPLALLRAMREVRARVPTGIPLELTILGEGPARARLERFVTRYGMSGWVRLPGRVAREELRLTYAGADIYVAPARLESFGIAALEARATGLPVVGLTGSGVAEFVRSGVNGYLASSDADLARCVARLALDTSLRAEMTAYNRRTPPEQSWPHVVERAESEYARAASLTSAASR